MMKHSWLSMGLLLVFGALGVALAANQPSEYTDATHGFKVRLPTVETPQLPPGLTTVVRFYAPPKNQFAANLGIQIQPWPKGKDLYQDNDVAESQFGSAGFRLLSRKQFKVGDHQALELMSTSQQGGQQLQFLTWLVARDDELFVLTCTALQATFEDYEKVCRAALNTFSFIDRQ